MEAGSDCWPPPCCIFLLSLFAVTDPCTLSPLGSSSLLMLHAGIHSSSTQPKAALENAILFSAWAGIAKPGCFKVPPNSAASPALLSREETGPERTKLSLDPHIQRGQG